MPVPELAQVAALALVPAWPAYTVKAEAVAGVERAKINMERLSES